MAPPPPFPFRTMLPALLLAACASYAPLAGATADNDDTTWQKYVRAPASQTVLPSTIVANETTGNVTNPDGLLPSRSGGGGPTVLTRLTADAAVPCLVVDFGQNYVGLLNIDFAGAERSAADSSVTPGYPGIQLAFSESLEYLTNQSDFTRSDNANSGDTVNKVVYDGNDQVAVLPDPYTWTDQQGCEYGNGTAVCSDGLHGFRYLKICLNDIPPGDPGVPTSEPYTSTYGTVAISAISLTYSGFRGTPDTFTGWFECSDEQLTQWWYDGVYTTDSCVDVFTANSTEPRNADSPSLLGKLVILDGAKRDRDPYSGDLAVSALTTYLSHDVAEAARNVLADLADHQDASGWIPPASINDYTLSLFDYPLWWVKCSYDHVLYTGNITYLETYWPVLVNVLDDFYPANTDSSTSLLAKPGSWGDYAFLSRSGIITYYNALYVLALQEAASLADFLAQESSSAANTTSSYATEWRARAATVSAALLARNWDASVGAFYDGGPCPGASSSSLCPTHAQDGNSLAILAGVTNNASSSNNNPAALAESALAYLANATARPYGNAFYDNDLLLAAGTASSDLYSPRVYAFISYFELAARFATSPSTSPTGFEELRRLYGWMSARDPGVTFWEGIGPAGEPYEGGFTSLSHGWSTGVTPLLTNYLLGVTPTAPGFAAWAVRPVVEGSGVTWAKGVVPTPGGGGIAVSWAVEGGGSSGGNKETFRLSVSAPAGMSGTVAVPVGGGDFSVSVDGRKVCDGVKGGMVDGSDVAYDGSYVSVQVDGGNSHVVTATSG